jgi:hypothetical protein
MNSNNTTQRYGDTGLFSSLPMQVPCHIITILSKTNQAEMKNGFLENDRAIIGRKDACLKCRIENHVKNGMDFIH